MINIKNKSHSVTAELDGPRGRRRGRDRRPGRRVRRLEPVRQGRQAEVLLQPLRRPALPRRGRRRRSRRARTRCAWSSPTTAAGSARAATVSLYVDGAKTGEGRVEGTVPMIFSADETCDVGSDTASPVSDDYTSRGQPLHRHGRVGADRHRRGRRGPRPPDLARGAPQDRDGAPVTGSGRRHAR